MEGAYVLIATIELSELADTANEYINKGYRPVGGVSTTTVHLNEKTGDIDRNGVERVQYVQAMVMASLTT